MHGSGWGGGEKSTWYCTVDNVDNLASVTETIRMALASWFRHNTCGVRIQELLKGEGFRLLEKAGP